MKVFPARSHRNLIFTKGFLLLAVAFCLLPACIFAFRRPAYNWDMLAYMALTLKATHSAADIDQLHKATYDIAREDIPSWDFGNLTTGPYREKMATDPEAFYAQLPAYAIKPLYIGMICLLYKAGLPLPEATWLPSVLSYFLMGLLLFYWIGKYFKLLPAFLSGLLIMYSPLMIGIARLSTPDGLSSLLLLAAFFLILEKPSITGISLLFVLSLFARLDNIVTGFIIVSFLFFSGLWKKKLALRQYILITATLAACYLVITRLLVAPLGGGLLYYPAFGLHQGLPYRHPFLFSLSEYPAFFYSQAITAVVYHHFTLFAFLALVAVFPFLSRSSVSKAVFEQWFVMLLILIILIRFILYPNLDDRFYVSFYLCILVLLIKKVSLFYPMHIQ